MPPLSSWNVVEKRMHEIMDGVTKAGGATYEQAAQELGVSHSVVRNRIHRLRTRLRADLSALRGTA